MDRRTRPIFPAAWSRWLTWRSNAGNRNARWRWPERQPAIRKRFHARTTNPARRAEVEKKIDFARKNAGAEAAALWMKGWNMSLDEIIEYAVEGGDDT